MKTTLPLLTLSMLLGGLLLGAERLEASQRVVVSLNVLPNATVSFDNLDPRDSNNQPIVSVAAAEDIQSLFQAGLFNLLVQSEIPSIANALSIIKRTLGLAQEALRQNLPPCIIELHHTLLPSVRRYLAKMLISLTGIFGCIAVTAPPVLTAVFPHRTSLQSAPLILRC